MQSCDEECRIGIILFASGICLNGVIPTTQKRRETLRLIAHECVEFPFPDKRNRLCAFFEGNFGDDKDFRKVFQEQFSVTQRIILGRVHTKKIGKLYEYLRKIEKIVISNTIHKFKICDFELDLKYQKNICVNTP